MFNTQPRISGDVSGLYGPDYYTDFSEYPTDIQPHDWSKHVQPNRFFAEVKDDPLAVGGKSLSLIGIDTAQTITEAFLAWDGPPVIFGESVEILLQIRQNIEETGKRSAGIRFTNVDYGKGLATFMRNRNLEPYTDYYGVLAIVFSAGGIETSKNTAEFPRSPSGVYNMRMRYDRTNENGGISQNKVWPVEEAEPVAWELETAHGFNRDDLGVVPACSVRVKGTSDSNILWFAIARDGGTATGPL